MFHIHLRNVQTHANLTYLLSKYIICSRYYGALRVKFSTYEGSYMQKWAFPEQFTTITLVVDTDSYRDMHGKDTVGGLLYPAG